jgi:hypothetical protein
MKYHDTFEWDPAKAKANQKKHGVTFELAEVVLADEQSVRESPIAESASCMKKSSASTNSLVRSLPVEIPNFTLKELDRLEAALNRPIDTSDIPETKKLGPRVKRDTAGRLQKRPLRPICKAILSALGHRQMTRYRLWQKARTQCPTLSQSAVYEYLRGERDIGVTYVEALMAASGVKVSATKPAAEIPKTTKRKLVDSGTGQ